MAGINQGVPETAIGEPIHFGDIDGFEIEQHPISDRLIIRDTANGKEAYVRAERGGEIGGDGVLIKALKEGKPMNDKGRTYDTIQEAERQASSWVFVPPGTFNESVTINTDGLTLRGSGYNTLISASGSTTIDLNAPSVTISNMSIENLSGNGFTPVVSSRSPDTLMENITFRQMVDSVQLGDNGTMLNCTVEGSQANGITFRSNCIISGCVIKSSTNNGVVDLGDESGVIANNIVRDVGLEGISVGDNPNVIIIGNRVINARDGINVSTDNNIIANNRVSDSTSSDIADNGTGTLLDGNLTGASN